MTKPPRREDLVAGLAEALGNALTPVDDTVSVTHLRRPPLHVLVVEDHEDNRRVVRGHLEAYGHHVTVARDGREGVKALRDGAYDVALVDLHMPRLDGFGVIETVRDWPDLPPLVAFSAHATIDVRRRTEEAGFDEFVAKPIGRRDLLGALRAYRRIAPAILVVDDSPDGRRLVQHLLRNTGRVEVASDGHQALKALSREPFDLVLMDLEMPVMGGLEAVKRLRARLSNQPPVLAITGHTDPNTRRECLEAGFTQVLVKPLRTRELLAAVEPYLTPKPRIERGPSQAPAPRRTARPPRSKNRVGNPGDIVRVDPDLADLIEPFLEDRRRDARHLREAIARGDLKTAARIGHTMKGSGGAYGFQAITTLGARIEAAARSGQPASLPTIVEALERYLLSVRWI